MRVLQTSVVGSQTCGGLQSHKSTPATCWLQLLQNCISQKHIHTQTALKKERSIWGQRERANIYVYRRLYDIFFCLPKVAVDVDVANVAAVRVAFLAASCQLPHSLFGFEAARVAKRTVSQQFSGESGSDSPGKRTRARPRVLRSFLMPFISLQKTFSTLIVCFFCVPRKKQTFWAPEKIWFSPI